MPADANRDLRRPPSLPDPVPRAAAEGPPPLPSYCITTFLGTADVSNRSIAFHFVVASLLAGLLLDKAGSHNWLITLLYPLFLGL